MTSNRCRPDRGLTTLEWLLIVAAVAGLAALAVVLVQNVVDETAEQIAGGSARITAAQVAAKAITDDADGKDDGKRSACNRLNITYSDAFGADPKRTALWTDGNTGGDTGGDCAIVTEAVAVQVRMADCGTADDTPNPFSLAERGGKQFKKATNTEEPGNTGTKTPGCVVNFGQ